MLRNGDFLLFYKRSKAVLSSLIYRWKTNTSYVEKMIKTIQDEQKKHKGFDRFSLKIPIKNYHFLCF